MKFEICEKILSLTFLLKPAFKAVRKDRVNIWFFIDWMLVLASVYCVFYVCWNLTDIFERQGAWVQSDLLVSILGTLLVLEACRRVIGWFMTGICLLAIVYAMYGPYMPMLIIHKGYSIERITTTLWLTTEGIFGLPLGVAATFVYVFVLFGAFLEVTGGGNFFIDLAYALTGRFSGGPAKTSVVASGFMGSVSGSAVGNVVATGSFTIPMMKKVGYRAHVAGAIEAAASTGGQLMPPIMGAGAFLMAEFTNISYLTIIKVALLPAFMYYVTVLVFVHYEAQKLGLYGKPKEELPKIGQVLKSGLHFILPIGILIYVLVANYSPMMAGFVAVLSTLLVSLAANALSWTLKVRRSPKEFRHPRFGEFALQEGRQIVSGLDKGARNAIMSWKLAKGLYIIPIIMAYRPLLGIGENYELLDWEVGIAVLVTTLGLVAFASALERYFFRKATWLETGLFWLAAAALLWPEYWADAIGLLVFALTLCLQKFTRPKGGKETTLG